MIEIVSLQDKSFCFILDCIIDQLTSMKKPIMIVIHINEKVLGEMISIVFKQRQDIKLNEIEYRLSIDQKNP